MIDSTYTFERSNSIMKKILSVNYAYSYYYRAYYYGRVI